MRTLLIITSYLFLGLFNSAIADEVELDGVRIPANTTPANLASTPFAAFQGTWLGTWDGQLKHVLIINQMDAAGHGSAIYALGGNTARKKKPRWFKVKAHLTPNKLTVSTDRFSATYTLKKSGKLMGAFSGGSGFAVLQKQNFAELVSNQTKPKWSTAEQIFLDTSFVENDRPVRLETLIYKPKGNGPFPLAVFNHGSTGSGTDKTAFSATWSNEWVAQLLNERGWLVAFPQRRGRGKSDGLYDEGFASDRSRGYSCNTKRSLAGAERALEDIKEAIKALKARPDVKDAPVLMTGQSRGGILATAYAGRHPEQVSGVINFVGGWMGDRCPNATAINQSLFTEGAKFPKDTLWIYGKEDRFYSDQHTKANFDAFIAAGGKGKYWQVTVPGKGNGHAALLIPPLWNDELSDYLDALKTD